MCEILTVVWPEPRPFVELELPALELERLGIAGFGWGVAWVDEDGVAVVHKDTGRFADDYRWRHRLEGVTSTRFLVHLRRPSRLSTIDLADTQPFLDEEAGFAFSHNGLLRRHDDHRERLGPLLHGAADSEVAFQLFRELLPDRGVADALVGVHEVLEGQANFVYLPAAGPVTVYGGHRENPFWTFDHGGGHFAVTGLHSTDDSLFDLVFPDATDREFVGVQPVELQRRTRQRENRRPA